MNKLKMRRLIDQLKTLTEEIESELMSDTDSYLSGTHLVDYQEILNYYNTNDDDEEGL